MLAFVALLRAVALALCTSVLLSAQTAPNQSIDELIPQLENRQPYVRAKTADTLGGMGPAAAGAGRRLSRLLLEDKDALVREQAVDALRRIGPVVAKDAVPALASVLDSKNPDEKARVIAALGDMGPTAVPALVKELTANSTHRYDVIEALAAIGPNAAKDKDVRQTLVKIALERKASKDDDPFDPRSSAVWALGKMAAVQEVVQILQKGDREIRSDAVSLLGNLGPVAASFATKPLAAVLLDDKKDDLLRQAAADALGNMGSATAKDSIPALIKVLPEDMEHLQALRDGSAEADHNPIFVAGMVENASRSLVRIAQALQVAEATDSIRLLKDSRQALEKVGHTKQSADVQLVVQYLELRRTQNFFDLIWLLPNWAKTALIPSLIYLVWFLVLRFALLPRTPLTLLRWNEGLEGLAYKLPKWLGEASVPFRKVVLIGFYHYHPRVLEAWVSEHAQHATESLLSLPAIKGLTTFVPLPVLLNGELLPELKPWHLQKTCAANQWRVLIKGEGGLGKTTLAMRIMVWALAENPAERLCQDRRMLPVLLNSEIKFDVRGDLATFKSRLRGQLKELIASGTPIPEGLFEKLLADRRVLVILDGVSEMPSSPPGPAVANAQNPDFPANALLITSRDEEREFGPKPIIEPRRIDANHLIPFINAYLGAAGQTKLTDSELFDASRQLSEIVTKGTGITPLLARLFAEQLIDLQKNDKPLKDLPRSVPDLMLSYLNSLNRDRAQSDPDNADVQKAAKIAAWKCLEDTFKPGQPGAKEAIRKALVDVGLSHTLLGTLETRLKILATVEPAESHVRFSLDPLTEYLAALYVVEQRAGSEECWRAFVKEADAKSGAPGSIRGFLAAVRDCCLATKPQVPSWVTNELAFRINVTNDSVS